MDRAQFPSIRSIFACKAQPAAGIVRRAAKNSIAPDRFADLFLPEDVLLDVVVAGKGEFFEEIALHLESVHEMPRAEVERALVHRERIESTALGEGVAIPHARIKSLDRIRTVYVRLKFAIPFDAPDGNPVTDVLVLLVPAQAAQEHLEVLAVAAQMFADRHFRAQLRLCSNPLEVTRLIGAWAGPVS
jgi:PTS system nitrogen regulatory IIA component